MRQHHGQRDVDPQSPSIRALEDFLTRCPAKIIGVMGTLGKSTTAAMTAAILKAAGKRVWQSVESAGGVLGDLTRMRPGDWVVLELSSSVMHRLNPLAPSPHILVVTNCRPNRRDWRAGLEDAAAMRRWLARQDFADIAILNPFDAEVGAWQPLVRGRLPVFFPHTKIPKLRTPGLHHRINAACAATAALAAGCEEIDLWHGLEQFPGLPQRLQLMAMIAGRRFYNDSASTCPESTIAALEAVEGPIWLLTGGEHVGEDFGALGEAVSTFVCGVAFFGEVRHRWHELMRSSNAELPTAATETMARAVRWCWRHSQSEDAIMLSPGCPALDQYADSTQRGEKFVELIRELAATRAHGKGERLLAPQLG